MLCARLILQIVLEEAALGGRGEGFPVFDQSRGPVDIEAPYGERDSFLFEILGDVLSVYVC